MQMRRRGDGDGIDAKLDQFFDGGDGGAAQSARDEFVLLVVGIGDADQVDAGQTGKDAGMV
jgi:hypothetical protein